jgi:hypothetical protein
MSISLPSQATRPKAATAITSRTERRKSRKKSVQCLVGDEAQPPPGNLMVDEFGFELPEQSQRVSDRILARSAELSAERPKRRVSKTRIMMADDEEFLPVEKGRKPKLADVAFTVGAMASPAEAVAAKALKKKLKKKNDGGPQQEQPSASDVSEEGLSKKSSSLKKKKKKKSVEEQPDAEAGPLRNESTGFAEEAPSLKKPLKKKSKTKAETEENAQKVGDAATYLSLSSLPPREQRPSIVFAHVEEQPDPVDSERGVKQ